MIPSNYMHELSIFVFLEFKLGQNDKRLIKKMERRIFTFMVSYESENRRPTPNFKNRFANEKKKN